eukprot:1161295-Pelagomonas_calceolata.AAC.15
MVLKSKIDLCFGAELRPWFAAAKCMQATCGSAQPDGITKWALATVNILGAFLTNSTEPSPNRLNGLIS